MKKVKIDFDFSKWGQEGISVYHYNTKVLTLHKHFNPDEDYYYGISETNLFGTSSKHLYMYQEIKPREIWVNEYPNNLRAYVFWDTKEDAETKLLNYTTPLKTIKFREVLDEPNEAKKV